jgi:choline dehydrogenase-like flavoprotein
MPGPSIAVGNTAKFIIVGSGGGGSTIAWMLAQAGHEVILLEQGHDIRKMFDTPSGRKDPAGFNSIVHDEEKFRTERPDPKRRPRGDYNTFRRHEGTEAKPFSGGWTGSVLGGGSVIWGAWSFRATPVDFKLASHFVDDKQSKGLDDAGYTVQDWPLDYSKFAPYYDLAEALYSVNGDRQQVSDSIRSSPWFNSLMGRSYFGSADDWFPASEYPCRPYPRTPVGQVVFDALDRAGMTPFTLPTAIVSPGQQGYSTRDALDERLRAFPGRKDDPFWAQTPASMWSSATRVACNMCGFCGEFLCWGQSGAKSGGHVSTIAEMQRLSKAKPGRVSIRTEAKAYEVVYDPATKRATGVRYLDIGDPDHPKDMREDADYVIVAAGTVQSARLLLMSQGPESGDKHGLGNSTGHLGRHVTFHMFGFSATVTLAKAFQGLARGEFGPTGNTASFWPYFVKNTHTDKWLKVGTVTSTAKKNPLENAHQKVGGKSPLTGLPLIKDMEAYARTIELRCTSDDLPMYRNRIDLDPNFVDEYGFPVARITRDLGPNEIQMQCLMEAEFARIFDPMRKSGMVESAVRQGKATVDLIGDHQMGSCRMGTSRSNSVIDANCRVWDAPNVFVVDASFMPTGLGLNPMITIVANALRVGSWMIKTLAGGTKLDAD